MNYLFRFFILITWFNGFGQKTPPPIQVGSADKINLISELTEVMDYELLFNEVKNIVTEDIISTNNIDRTPVDSIMTFITFEELPDFYKFGMYLNIHSDKTEDEIDDLIQEFSKYTDVQKMEIEVMMKYGVTAIENYFSYINSEFKKRYNSGI